MMDGVPVKIFREEIPPARPARRWLFWYQMHRTSAGKECAGNPRSWFQYLRMLLPRQEH